MCGRYSRRRNSERLAAEFDAEWDRLESDLPPDYNIAPGQNCAVITSGNRILTSMRWGLVPSWSKTDTGFATRINACAETLTDRSSYRPILARGRCAIPADGFYEWQKPFKQPYYFKLQNDRPFLFAGLSDTWEKPDGSILKTFTVITTSPNELVSQVHERMPAILAPKNISAWLDSDTLIADALRCLAPYPAEAMQKHPVRPLVNSVKNNGPHLIDPIEPPQFVAQSEFAF